MSYVSCYATRSQPTCEPGKFIFEAQISINHRSKNAFENIDYLIFPMQELTQSVTLFIAMDMQPYSVEDVALQQMLRKIDKRYVLPSRTHCSTKKVPKLYDQLRQQLLKGRFTISFKAYKVPTTIKLRCDK